MTPPSSRDEIRRFEVEVADLAFEIEALADLDRAVDRAACIADDDVAAAHAILPYFGVLWPSALAVAEHLARMGDRLRDRTVLELGCGLALPSLVARRRGARVVATDHHPRAHSFIERNLELNDFASGDVAFRSLDWTQPSSDLGRFEFVVGSDLLYEAGQPSVLARALASHCSASGEIVLGDPGRTYLQECIDALGREGFEPDVRIHPVRDDRRDRAGDRVSPEVFVIVFRRPRDS
ncbi:MAG: methyltransferase domain-containing protein [Planctomycetes bacterium]|nr:methyltransferase domain-containing protein [Planctomycetota bacterium]MBI3846169.1 methyltransferase domain-containing protein [Planctomycetota bacterium]